MIAAKYRLLNDEAKPSKFLRYVDTEEVAVLGISIRAATATFPEPLSGLRTRLNSDAIVHR